VFCLCVWRGGLFALPHSIVSTSYAFNPQPHPPDNTGTQIDPPYAVKRQLPALLLWLAAAGVESGTSGEAVVRAEELAAALSPEQMEELGRSLQKPSSGLKVFAQYLRAQQALEGAPATVEQVSRSLCCGRRACLNGVADDKPRTLTAFWPLEANAELPC